MLAVARTWRRPEDNLQEQVLSLHPVGSSDQLSRLGNNHLCPLGHLTSPLCNLNVTQARLSGYLCRQLCADLAPVGKRNPWAKDPEVHQVHLNV